MSDLQLQILKRRAMDGNEEDVEKYIVALERAVGSTAILGQAPAATLEHADFWHGYFTYKGLLKYLLTMTDKQLDQPVIIGESTDVDDTSGTRGIIMQTAYGLQETKADEFWGIIGVSEQSFVYLGNGEVQDGPLINQTLLISEK